MYVPGNSSVGVCNVRLMKDVYPHEVRGNLKTNFYLQCWFLTMSKSEVDMDSYRHGLGSSDKTLGMVEGELRKHWAWLS